MFNLNFKKPFTTKAWIYENILDLFVIDANVDSFMSMFIYFSLMFYLISLV